MHNPRGSNNRLGETNNDQTANEQRLFDSQNNNNGGYVWGPPMYYIEGSVLPIEWTNQHSCGPGEGKANCNIVIQYMCNPFLRDGATPPNPGQQPGTPGKIPFTPGDATDGQFTAVNLTQEAGVMCDDNRDFDAGNQQFCYRERRHVRRPVQELMRSRDGASEYAGWRSNPSFGEYAEFEFGMHEAWSNYQKCYYRERNKGLFIADEDPGNSAVDTRQQDNGRNDNNRFGYECTEERDYYPYWHPSPWHDIAVLTDNLARCRYFRDESQNVKSRRECIMPGWRGNDPVNHPEFLQRIGKNTPASIPNNEVACEEVGGTWKKVPSHNIDAPECLPAPWARDNHLGNTWTPYGAYAPTYNWTIDVPDHMLWSRTNPQYCTLRIRYNISTFDYESWGDDSPKGRSRIYQRSETGNPFQPIGRGAQEEERPIGNNPEVSYGMASPFYYANRTTARRRDSTLQLALNSDQFGRTFQDRSHAFRILERPDDVPDSAIIWNVNVRGKRGNIVQAYPGVEYDFVPNHLAASVGDYIHFQWTGGDSTPNNGNNNAEGRTNTDRSNFVLLKGNNLGTNYPSNYFSGKIDGLELFSDDDNEAYARAMRMAHQDQAGCKDPELVGPNSDDDEGNCEKLNRAPRYFDLANEAQRSLEEDSLVKLRKSTGGRTYNYYCTRNNNFSNRGQKGVVVVGEGEALPRWLIVIIGAVTIVATILVVVPVVLVLPSAISAVSSSISSRL